MNFRIARDYWDGSADTLHDVRVQGGDASASHGATP
jgi:hypothetical protein